MLSHLFIIASSTALAAWFTLGMESPVSGIILSASWAALCTAALESRRTFSRSWHSTKREVFARDARLAVVSALITQAILTGSAMAVATLNTGWRWFAADLSLALQVLVYLTHRAMHRFTPLWRVHAEHHRAEQLYWLNTLLAHTTPQIYPNLHTQRSP